jgi:hypothetical protein
MAGNNPFKIFGHPKDNFHSTTSTLADGARSLANMFSKNGALGKIGKQLGTFFGVAGGIAANLILAPIYAVGNLAKKSPVLFTAVAAFAAYKGVERWSEKREQKQLAELQQENEQIRTGIQQLSHLQHEMYNPLAEGKPANHFQNMVSSPSGQAQGHSTGR